MKKDTLPLCEETFGPLAPIYRFKTEEEAVQMANNTPYGLAAYFCTRDLGRAMRVSEALESGIIGINEGIISSEVAPFGGIKESGIGPRRWPPRHGRIHRNQIYPNGLCGIGRVITHMTKEKHHPKRGLSGERAKDFRRRLGASRRRQRQWQTHFYFQVSFGGGTTG